MTTQRDWGAPLRRLPPPDFENLLTVLRRERPSRPTLFEFPLNARLAQRLLGNDARGDFTDGIEVWRRAGYDYVMLSLPGFTFASGQEHRLASISQNEGSVVSNRSSFDAHTWPDADRADFGLLDRIADAMPKGMKIIIMGPRGVLENAVRLVGYQNLCIMMLDDPQLAEDVFERVGTLLSRYYKRCVQHPAVGAILGNDDWGFKSQTMLRPADIRRLVVPWHREIVGHAHAAGKPAIMHSCGNLAAVMDDVIDDIKYDGKHSWEDGILPVEEAYEKYGDRIAIIGGIDVDFVIRSTREAVYERANAMLNRAGERGGYALGTGNSVPEYVPDDHYLALTAAALDRR